MTRHVSALLLSACSTLASCSAGPSSSTEPTTRPSAPTPTPKAEQTFEYDIVFGGRVAGRIKIVHHADGTFDEAFEFDDRGNGPKTRARLELGADGLPDRFELTGHDYRKREVHELLVCDAAKCTWEGKDERGEGPRGFYVPSNQSLVANQALLARALEPNGARLLPGGTLRALPLAETTLTAGSATIHVRAIELSGYGFEPSVEWYDDAGAPFAQVDDFGAGIRKGWKDSIPKLLELQRPFAQARRDRIANATSRRHERIAVVHARLFDPSTKTVTEDATIVIEGGKVKTVGAKLPAPKEATILDATGRTVLPGLWDMHAHVRDEDGLMDLANGVTTVRDLGSEIDAAVGRRDRWMTGRELGPRLLLAGFVDGHGPKEAPFQIFADTPEQARSVVDDYAAKGYLQMKIYGSMSAALVPIIATRAHDKRMRVSGHIPARMTAADVVGQGYDEIQHIEHIMMDLLSTGPDDARSAVKVAERAAAVDLDGPRVKALLDLLARKRIVVDPTLNVVEGELLTRPDRPNPTVAPFLGRLPAQVRRQAVGGALPVAEGMDATYKQSFQKCMLLVKRMWDRKIPIVAGTDAWTGFALHRELELYSLAGIPNADVLALATLGAATIMNLSDRTGSLSPGKDADLILVDGDPLARMSDIRNVVTVVLGGTVIDAAALQRALSIEPR